MSKRFFFYFLIVLCISYNSYGQILQERVDSLISEFGNMPEKERSKTFIKIFSTKYVLNDIDTAKAFAEKIEQYALANNDTILLIGAKVLYSECYWRKGAYKKGMELALKSIALAETNERFQLEKAQGLQTAGSINFFSGNPLKAIEYYKKAAKVFLENDRYHSYTAVVSNIGAVYANLAENPISHAYQDSALHYLNLVIELKDKSLTSRYLAALGNSAFIHIQRKNYDEAQKLYDQWEEIESKNPNLTSRASQYGARKICTS